MGNPYKTKDLSELKPENILSVIIKKIQKNFLVLWFKITALENRKPYYDSNIDAVIITVDEEE
jgi:hypothetical protein